MSGNNNHGQIAGPTTATGQVGLALNFDGSNDYVNVPDPGASSLDLQSTLTLEAWVNPDTSPADALIVGKENSYLMAIRSGTLQYAIRTAGTWAWINTGLAVPTGTWSHVAIVYNGTTTTGYVNGAPDPTPDTDPDGGSVDQNNNPVCIGSRGTTCTTAATYFDGRIDEVAIYNVALDACEIQDHMNGIFAIPDGIIDGKGDNFYGALGTGAGGESTRTVTSGTMYSYALSVQNEGSTAAPFKLVWNTPAGWTVKLQDCTGSGCVQSDSPFTTASIPAGGAAVYTLSVTPPAGGDDPDDYR